MNPKVRIVLAGWLLSGMTASVIAQTGETVSQWLTKADRSVLFQKQQKILTFKAFPGASSPLPGPGPAILVDDSRVFQPIDGFGFALTGGSAMHISRMSKSARATLLTNLFATDGRNIGVSYLRLSIGSSDLNECVFSYDDCPKGETDTGLKRFDLGPDRSDVIPVLKEILAIAPGIKILGSPWSPPAWMKTNEDTRGGRLKPEYYPVYAAYFVKYIRAMKAEGIAIDAITVQNEPLHPGNNPSLLLVAPDEAEFVKNHLGPAFKAAGITTKIIIYDHNADRIDYPLFILKDPEAAKYIDGSGFHLYGGEISALSEVHNAFPGKNLYFTEQMVVEDNKSPKLGVAWPVSELIIGATRNWCRNVLEWNLASNPDNTPYTDRGGCDACQGAVTIDEDRVTRNIGWYSMAHVSKFVRPGSRRIGSNEPEGLRDVAFRTPEGRKVLVVANTGDSPRTFHIVYKGKAVASALEGGSVATYIW